MGIWLLINALQAAGIVFHIKIFAEGYGGLNMKYQIIASAFFLTVCNYVCAADRGSESFGHKPDRHEWQTVTGDMSAGEYRNSYRHNQRIVRDFVKSYSESTLTSIGVPKSGVKLMGAAAGLAAGQDARLYLNKSKIMALEFKDATEDDRAVFFGIKMDW
jgi:hypothetical protein